MEQRGTIRRSRRLRERGRREKNEGRKAVGDELGVTPVRGKAVNLAEARAMQDARAAAGAWDDDNVHVPKGKSSYGYRLPQDITTQGPVRCLGPWGQCYKPGDMMMVHNHLTKTKNKLS